MLNFCAQDAFTLTMRSTLLAGGRSQSTIRLTSLVCAGVELHSNKWRRHGNQCTVLPQGPYTRAASGWPSSACADAPMSSFCASACLSQTPANHEISSQSMRPARLTSQHTSPLTTITCSHAPNAQIGGLCMPDRRAQLSVGAGGSAPHLIGHGCQGPDGRIQLHQSRCDISPRDHANVPINS